MFILKPIHAKNDGTIFKPRFLNLDTVDIWDQMMIFFFLIKHFPIHGRRFSSVPGCYPVNIMSTSQCDNPKCLYMLAQLCPTLCDSIGGDCQTPLSMGFSRQEYWSGLSFLPPGDVPNPGIEPVSSMPPALAGGLFYY